MIIYRHLIIRHQRIKEVASTNKGLFKQLFIIHRLHFHILKEKLEKCDIHPGQPPMLMLIAKRDGINQNHIAKKLNVSPATVAIMLRRMEKADLVFRKHSENDRRFQHVYLTEKGREVVKIIKYEIEKTEQIATDGFSESEKKELEHLLNHVIDNLKKHAKEGCHD